MSTERFLADLLQKGLILWVENGKLRFQAPKGTLTPSLRVELAARKTEIITLLGEQKYAPLSFAQEQLWFLDQLRPGSPFYNIPILLRITGRLDVVALEQSLNEIVKRHQSLRATFTALDGRPVQVIAPTLTLKLSLKDLQQFPDSEREMQARRWAVEEAKRPFDLERSPLVWATLLQLNAEDYVLLLNTHHIISDGWSMGVLIQELAALYPAFSGGNPTPLPELPIQYTDFVTWQRQRLQGEELAQHLDYWKAQVDGRIPVLALPTDRLRPAVQSYRGARLSCPLSTILLDRLERLGRPENASMFMILFAAFQTLLHRYSAQTDIVVGIPVANRSRRVFEELIGFFVNTLALRVDLSGNPTFRELIARVRQVALGAYAHQDLPLEKLIEVLDLERDLSYNPLFQAMLAVQNVPIKSVQLPEVRISFVGELDTGTAKFDLTLLVEFPEHGPVLIAEYNTDLFEAVTIERLLNHFQVLLEGIIVHPDHRLSDLPLLTACEREQLVVEWNDTHRDYPREATIPQLFEAQVARTPRNTALVCGDARLTYSELNRRANQLAHHLRRLGVRPDVCVGLSLERSVEMVVSLLAVLKAGGAYVPIDPTYPQERLAFMLTDAHVPVLLTQQRLVDSMPVHVAHLICLDTDWPVIARESDENLSSEVTPDHLMYVIYTSGSTGRPKGAGVYQRGFVNLLHWFVTDFALGDEDKVLLITSFSFDLTQKNFYAPLIVGGELHLLPSEYYDPHRIREAVHDKQVTWLNCTPSAFYTLVDDRDAGAFTKLASLRYVFLGGEPISMPRLWEWIESPYCQAEIVNTYGPTECADICAFYRLDQPEQFLGKAVPLGQPIPNARLFILDWHLGLLPVGVVGELCVAGAGVGLGYVNDLALTAAKFVPHPHGGEPGERLYRTGDLARYRPDGSIEFLGRADHQVKVRGFRVELGEIETVLGQHAAVQEAVVMAQETGDESGDQRLVAYVVSEEGTAPTTNELGRFLRRQLPDYMVPSAFVLLATLPLTPSGKVDRRALPAPAWDRSELEEVFVAPRTPIEKALADIWAQVLALESVGVHDSFFNLGGHSLMAIQVLSRAREAFKIEIPVQTIFETPTVAGLAQTIDEVLQTGALAVGDTSDFGDFEQGEL